MRLHSLTLCFALASSYAEANLELPQQCTTEEHVATETVKYSRMKKADTRIAVREMQRQGDSLSFEIRKEDVDILRILFGEKFGLYKEEHPELRNKQTICPAFQISSNCYSMKEKDDTYLLTVKLPPKILEEVEQKNCVIGPLPAPGPVSNS